MKKSLSIILLCLIFFTSVFFTSAVIANPYNWKVVRVLDGDTVEVAASWLPPELGTKIKIRIKGVDTPEKRPLAKCDQEAAKALLASAFTREFIKSGKNIVVNIYSWDKYGGRVIGDVIVDDKSLREQLIFNGHARPYDGGTKSSWCK